MIFGIYARKSVYAEDSDSIETQIKICEEYINSHFENIKGILKYIDEGYTGANTQRPAFNLLLNDVHQKKIDALVCYKIDRISRNVIDFSKTFEELQTNGIQFISVKEQIDTSTPLGRAMMYICSVFAQMERETIAERVKDNMLELAKAGKWPGGKAPLGYKLQRVMINSRIHSILVENPDELSLLNYIFDSFLEGNTLSGLETKFRKENIKSINGKYFSSTQIHQILSCPHYVAATKEIYDYFKAKGCIMVPPREEFDGTHGLLVYGRTSGGKRRKHVDNPPNMWVVTIGLHKPLISAEKWLAVQERFGKNKFNKTRKHQIGILKGIIRCKCGRKMATKRKYDKVYGKVYEHYFCRYRERTCGILCDAPMVSIEDIDSKVLALLKHLSVNKKDIELYMNNDKDNIPFARNAEIIKKEISECKRKISNLADAIQNNTESTAVKYLVAEIEKLDKQLISLEFELREAELKEKEELKRNESIDIVYEKIVNYIREYESLPYEEKNRLLSDIIKECVYKDGELIITL